MRLIRLSMLPVLAIVALAAVVQPAHAAGDDGCIRGPFVKKYFSQKADFSPDHSYVKLTWQPEFCKDGKTWRAENDPVLQLIGPASLEGKGINLDAPRRWPNSIRYDGQGRQCVPLSVSVRGIGLEGTGCATFANFYFTSWIDKNKRVHVYFPKPRNTALATGTNTLWTNSVI